MANAATMYTAWNTTMFGAVPANFSAGYSIGDGFLVIAACAAGTMHRSPGQCGVCAPGTYAATIGSSACAACAPGSYSTVMASTACTSCALGTYATSATSSACTPCAAGTYSPMSGVCLSCPANTALTAAGSCVANAGYYLQSAPVASYASTVALPPVAGGNFLVFNRDLSTAVFNLLPGAPVGVTTAKANVSIVQTNGQAAWSAGYPVLANATPFLWYQFDSGACAADSSGNNQTLTGYGGIACASAYTSTIITAAKTPMRGNQAAFFAAASLQYFSIPVFALPTVQATTGITIAFWGLMAPNQAYARFFELSGDKGSGCLFDSAFDWVRDGTTTHTYLMISSVGVYLSSYTDVDSQWHHRIVSIDSAGRVYLWLDGVPIFCPSGCSGGAYTSNVLNNSLVASKYSYYLGKQLDSCGNAFLDGGMDDVRFYSTVLTNAQAYELYAGKVEVYAPFTTLPALACSASCGGGTYARCLPNGKAVCCGGGAYFVEGLSTACQLCAVGTYGLGNATACLTCGGGAYAAIGSSACTTCPLNNTIGNYGSRCVSTPGYAFVTTGGRFPPSAMTAASTTISSEVFVASASSAYSAGNPEDPYRAFNYASQSGATPYDWTTSGISYSGTGKTYAGTTYATVIDGAQYYGEWLQLQVGVARQLSTYSLQAATYSPGRAPAQFVVAGSADGGNWTLIDNQTTSIAWTVNSVQTFTPAQQLGRAFTYFRLVVLATGSTGDGYVSIEEWMLYPGATTPCAAGTYASSASASACVACVAGTYAMNTTSTACAQCPAGTYSVVGASACVACPTNSQSTAGASACTAIAQGYYNLGANLVAYYPFNPGQMPVDVSGQLGALTIPQSAPLADCTTAASGPGGAWASSCVSATQNNANLFSSSTLAQYLQMPGFVLPNAFSFCLWYQPTPASSVNAYEAPFEFKVSVSGNLNLFMMQRSTSLSGFTVFADNGVFSPPLINWTPGTLYFAASTWYHICFTFAGPAYIVYVNGNSLVSATMTAALDSTQIRAASFLFGCGYTPCFQGKLDEVRLYNKTLSVSEVSALYAFRGDTYTAVMPLPCAAGSCTAPQQLQCTTLGAPVCCAPGTYWVPSATAAGCTLCPAGTYGLGNATACAACAAGTFAPLGNSSACTACVFGVVGNAMTTCTTAPTSTKLDARGGNPYWLGPDGITQTYANAALASVYGPTSFPFGPVVVSDGVTTTVGGQLIPRGVQLWTPNVTATYALVAAGAAGQPVPTRAPPPGNGVVVVSSYTFYAGQTVAIVVGQQPTIATGVLGGGGGTFVSVYSPALGAFSVAAAHTPILVAGGGGGPGLTACISCQSSTGINAVATQSSANCVGCGGLATGGGGGGACSLAGGLNGANGATMGTVMSGGSCGGGGFFGNGGDNAAGTDQIYGGKAFVNGAQGGLCWSTGGGFGGTAAVEAADTMAATRAAVSIRTPAAPAARMTSKACQPPCTRIGTPPCLARRPPTSRRATASATASS